MARPRRALFAWFLTLVIVAAGLASPSAAKRSAAASHRPTGFVSGSARARPLAGPVPAQWLAAFNYYRNLATPNLPDVVENEPGDPADNYSHWDKHHAIYMTETQSGVDHMEVDTPATNAWYHPKGHESAQNSNLAWTSDIKADAVWGIEGWMTAPFHGLQMLDPYLHETGFGIDHKSGVTFKTGVGVDVSHDDTPADNPLPGGFVYPVRWPGTNKTIYLDRYEQSETPNPFGAGPCTSYDGPPSDPTGPPVYLIFGPGTTVQYQDSTFMQGSNELLHCAYDGGDYGGPHGTSMQQLNAIFLFPEKPLKSEKTYNVHIETTNGNHDWSFKIGDLIPPTSRITKPDHNQTVDQDSFNKLVGKSSGGTSRVDVAIANLKSGQCKFMSANGNFGSRKNCFKQTWLKANGKTDWTFTLPEKLPPTFNPRTGAQNGQYLTFSRGRDQIGNIEFKFNSNRNQIGFHVVP